MLRLARLVLTLFGCTDVCGDLELSLWDAFKQVTAFSDTEISHLVHELASLRAPSQRGLWQEKVHCSYGTCAAEAASRLIAALGENNRLPARTFELFPGDPLYNLWKESDTQPFHSWIDGQGAKEDSIEALIPEGQPLSSGRIQAAREEDHPETFGASSGLLWCFGSMLGVGYSFLHH